MSDLAAPLSSHGLEALGIARPGAVLRNLTRSALVEQAIASGEGRLSHDGAFVALTGEHTGRSPRDKYIVEDAETRDTVWWGKVNQKMSPATFAALARRLAAHCEGKRLYVQDLWAGADAGERLRVRVVTRQAWHALFARNMFIRPEPHALEGFEPDFTVLQVPEFVCAPDEFGIRSGTVITVDFTRRLVLIAGTSYAGEIKKSIFGVLNFLLPARGVLPMHCSATQGPGGDVAVFFGLSGTGKTTLSADPTRTLIGDDEHGWSERGVFNFEGGCYAKVIRLSAEAEPEIYATTRRFGTILENVVMDTAGRLDLEDGRFTENTRASYPLEFIPNASETGLGGHPTNIIMLTADAFGVLPPIARLTPEQAMYHFLSGYTARVAGTEKGVTEPEATFSACFGAPFMPRHPVAYAQLLGEKMRQHRAACWLVNTGWTGGAYGTGKRMAIGQTRALVRAALTGVLARGSFRREPDFGLEIPTEAPGVPAEVLDPRSTWVATGAGGAAYDRAAAHVAALFEKNFAQFAEAVDASIRDAGIRAAA